MKSRNVNKEDAFRLLYSSFLYSKLEKESAKLWHLSLGALCELLNGELDRGSITFPMDGLAITGDIKSLIAGIRMRQSETA
jgi:hypothetical protein